MHWIILTAIGALMDLGVRRFTNSRVRLACSETQQGGTFRMISRTTPRANTTSRGTIRLTKGNSLHRAAGFAYWYALPSSHAMKLLK